MSFRTWITSLPLRTLTTAPLAGPVLHRVLTSPTAYEALVHGGAGALALASGLVAARNVVDRGLWSHRVQEKAQTHVVDRAAFLETKTRFLTQTALAGQAVTLGLSATLGWGMSHELVAGILSAGLAVGLALPLLRESLIQIALYQAPERVKAEDCSKLLSDLETQEQELFGWLGALKGEQTLAAKLKLLGGLQELEDEVLPKVREAMDQVRLVQTDPDATLADFDLLKGQIDQTLQTVRTQFATVEKGIVDYREEQSRRHMFALRHHGTPPLHEILDKEQIGALMKLIPPLLEQVFAERDGALVDDETDFAARDNLVIVLRELESALMADAGLIGSLSFQELSVLQQFSVVRLLIQSSFRQSDPVLLGIVMDWLPHMGVGFWNANRDALAKLFAEKIAASSTSPEMRLQLVSGFDQSYEQALFFPRHRALVVQPVEALNKETISKDTELPRHAAPSLLSRT